MLAALFYYFVFMLCALNIINIYFNIINKKMMFSKKLFIFLIALSIIAAIINYYNIILLKSFFSLITLCIIMKLCYGYNLKNTITYAIFVWSFGMILDIVCSGIYSVLINRLPERIVNIYGIAIMYVLTFVLQLFYNLISRSWIFKKAGEYFHKIVMNIKSSYIITLFFVIAITLLGIVTFQQINNIIVIVTMLIFTIVLFVLQLKAMYYEFNWKQSLKANKNLIDDNKFYFKLNSDFREFKHNIVHKLNGVKSYGTKKSNEMIDEILLESKMVNSMPKQIENLPVGISGLIYRKIYEYDDKLLKVVVDNNVDYDFFEILKARNYNKLCEVLGVALDNAIQATQKSNDRILFINIDEKEDYLIISVKNTFNSMLDLDKVGLLNYTTKSNGHGIGLFSILFHKELRVNLKVINNIFEVNIKVLKNKKA